MFSSGLDQNGEDEEGINGFLPEDIVKEWRRYSYQYLENDFNLNLLQGAETEVFLLQQRLRYGGLRREWGEVQVRTNKLMILINLSYLVSNFNSPTAIFWLFGAFL